MSPHNNKKRSSSQKGYRLHDRKIDYSGGTGSMRTIKYELVDIGTKYKVYRDFKKAKHNHNNDPLPLRNRIAQAVKKDNQDLYGVVNFNDYIENWDAENSKPKPEYSFLGFWLEALSLGFVFSNKAEEQFKTYLGIESAALKNFNHMPEEYRNCFDKNKWCDWFNAGNRGLEQKNEVQRKNILINLTVNGKDVPDEVMKKWLDVIDNDPKKTNDEEWRKELFGISTSDYSSTERLDAAFSRTESIKKEFGLENYKKADWAWSAAFPHDQFRNLAAKGRTTMTDKLADYWTTEINEKQVNKKWATIFLGIGDNGNYLNNGILGNFFHICRKIGTSDQGQELAELVAEDLCDTYGYSNEERERLTDGFAKMGEYARRLPEKPQLAGKWADYRSDFNGTLESWHSNYFGKRKAAVEEVEELEKLLHKIGKVLDGDSSFNGEEKEKAVDSLGSVLNLIEKNQQNQRTDPEPTDDADATGAIKIDREFSNNLQEALADLRRELNSYNQKRKVVVQGKKNKGDSVGILDDKLGKNWQEKLKKRIQLSPLFFGESAKESFEKTIGLKKKDNPKSVPNLFRQLEETVREKCRILGEAESVREKTVDRLAELYKRLKDDRESNGAVIVELERIAAKVGANFSERTEKARFYVSGFEKQKISLLPYNKKLFLKELIDVDVLLDLYRKAADTPQKNNLLRDVAQLSKILTAALLYSSGKEEQYGNTFSHSELSGYANLIGKKEFISKYAVQATNGGQVKIAVVNAKSKKNQNLAEKYAYTFPYFTEEFSETFKVKPIKLQGKNGSITAENIADIGAAKKFTPEFALEVRSSKYQVQFLDWFLSRTDESKGHRKKKTKLAANGAFTIAEQKVFLDWSGDVPVVLPDTDDSMRVFISQPFTIEPKDRIRESKDPERFIGIDIGEFGLAYSVVEVKPNDGRKAAEILDQGFIDDRQQKVLKDYVREKRKKQVRATFSSPDTKIARLRESLVGAYRNQLQALAIKWNATLSFEFEVSAFESGGSRISKVYDSIKRGDVYGTNKAKKDDTKQAWGEISQKDGKAKKNTQMVPWAVEATAAGTSQTCTKCKRWASLASREKGNDPKDYYGTVRVLRGNGIEFVSISESAAAAWTGEEWKKLRSETYAAMRPPLKEASSAGIQIVKEKISEGSLILGYAEGKRPMSLDEFAKRRGNSSVYICPYTDCHHIADADLQAAFNIALRGYIKNRDKEKQNVKEWPAAYLVEETRKIEFSPVGFHLEEQESEPALMR